MKIIISILGLALVATLCSAANNYLLFASESPFGEDELKSILNNLDEAQRYSAEGTRKYIQEVAGFVDRVLAPHKSGQVGLSDHGPLKNTRVILDRFLDLSRQPSAGQECSVALTNELIRIIELSFGSVEAFMSLAASGSESLKHANLFVFLEEYAFDRYKRCLDAIERDEKAILEGINQDVEHKFDTMTGNLGIAVNELDFVSGRFDVKKMLNNLSIEAHEDANQQLVAFLFHQCNELRKGMAAFDSYNLGATLLPHRASLMNLSSRFHKLNEYSRLCTQLRNPKTQAAAFENIKMNTN